jgi:hypothetical protein
MKTLLNNAGVLLGLAGILLAGCEKPDNDIPDAGFDVALFSQNLKKNFEGKTVGYAFAIAQDGKIAEEGHGGLARRGKDAELPYLQTTRQETSTGTQTLTALAILKALENKGLNENAYIWEFLPGSWNIPYANRKITFAHLLMHKSGLKYVGSGFLSLRSCMQTHTTGFGDSDVYYDNNAANYLLCRILLSAIVNGKGVYEGKPDEVIEDELAQFYRSYVRQHIFKAAGVPDWSKIEPGDWNQNGPVTYKENPPDRNATLYYNFSNPSLLGVTFYNSYKWAGTGSWYVNPTEIASTLMAAEAYKIVSPAMLQRMKNKLMGFDAGIKGRHGNYYWKGGTSRDALYRGTHTVIMHFPNNVQVAWNTNSTENNLDGAPEDLITAAYENAWK